MTFKKGGQVKKYQKDLEKEVHGMSYKGKDFLKKILKKARGGEVEKDKRDLHKEVAGMGPEGKAFLRDKLGGKDYEGKLKSKYREDLEKELKGMSGAGRASLKKMVEPKDAWKDVKKELDGAKERNPKAKKAGESIGELMAYSREGYAKGGEAKDWIQGAVKKPGALRAVAKKDKLIKGDEKLSGSDLSKLAKKAKEKGNKLLAKRVALAKTFAKMRKK